MMRADDALLVAIKACYQACQQECLDYKRHASDYYWQFFLLVAEKAGLSKQQLLTSRSAMTPQEVELILKHYLLMQRENSFKLLKTIKRELNCNIKAQHEQLWNKAQEELEHSLPQQGSDFFFQAMWVATSLLQTAQLGTLEDDDLALLLMNVKLLMLVCVHIQQSVEHTENKIQVLRLVMEYPVSSNRRALQQLETHRVRLQSVINFKNHSLSHGPCTHVLPLTLAPLEPQRLSF